MKAKTKTNLWKKITIGLGISFVLICAVAIFSLSGIGYKASLSNIENSKDINFNITEQNIKTGDTPSSIKIITDRSFDINLEDGGTGLQGQLTGSNTYEFITTAKTSGVAYLNIIDSDNSLISSRSKINVFDSAPNINISHQKAHLKNQAKSIKIFAGEGDFSFVLDSGETGLTGNKNSENPAIFDFDANSATKTGTATLSIYQKDTSDLIAESKISLYLDNLKANTDSQVVAVGEDLDPFEIHGGSDEYNFEFKAAQTGLEGHQNGNKFVFDNQALQKGNAQLIVSDKNNPEISKALQIVVIESQVSYIDISLTNCNTESTLMVGKTCQLKALATLEDNNQIDLTNLVVWQEYNQIGSINLNKLEISKEGTALITAKFNGVISRNKLNIKSLDSPRLKSIKSKTNCNKGYAFTGQTCALSAIATFDDNSSGDISEFVQWKNAEQFGAIQGLVLKIENIYNGELFAQFGTIISDNTINLETRNLALAQKIKVSTDCDLSSPIDTHDICTLNATGIFEDGDIEVSDAVEWRDFENIGEIHEQNKLLITKAGEANIYAFLNGKKSSNTIDIHTIDTEKIDYFEIYSPNCDTQKSIVINSTCELRVQAIFENGYKGDITHIMDFDGFEQIGSLQSNTLKITSKGQGLIRAFNDQIKMVSNNNIFINVIAPQTLSYFYIESTDCDLTSPIIQGKKCSIYATGVMEDGSMVDISSFVQFQGQNTIGSIENGIIEATNKGQGIIEATYGQARSSNALTVQVKDINSITSFKIHIKDIENGQKLLKDGKYELKAIATLDNGYKTDISDIVKYSGCNDIGVIKGNTLYVQDLGSCSIKASINNKESENTLTIQSVSSSEIESLELTSPNCALDKAIFIGEECIIKSIATLKDKSDTDASSITVFDGYEPLGTMNDNKLIVTRASQGVIEGRINSVSRDLSTESFAQNEISYIKIDSLNCKHNNTVVKGTTCVLTAEAITSENQKIDITNSVTWRYAPPEIAILNNNHLTFAKEGKLDIEAVFAEKKSINKLTIESVSTELVSSFEVKMLDCNTNVNLLVGDICTLQALATMKSGEVRDITNSIEWIGDYAIGDLKESRYLEIKKAGKGSITATLEKKPAKNTINFSSIDPKKIVDFNVELLNCDYQNSNVKVNNTCIVSAIANLKNGEKADITEKVQWIGTEIIGDLSGRNLKITKSDQSVIYAVYEDKESNNKIQISTIDPKEIVLFEISSPNCEEMVKLDSVCFLEAQAIFKDGSKGNVTGLVEWKNFENIGSISDNKLEINKHGKAVITGMIDNKEAKAPITFYAFDELKLESIEISATCPESEPKVDDICTLKAIGKFNGEIEKDISSEIEWKGFEQIGEIQNEYYLKITKENTASIKAIKDDIISNSIEIIAKKTTPEIISIRTTGNTSLAKGTHDKLMVEVKNIYGINDLDKVEISLVKDLYCNIEDIPPTAQTFDIVESGATPSFGVSGNTALLELPFYVPLLNDLTDGKHTITITVFNSEGKRAEAVYPISVGIPSTGDINYDGKYSTIDAILAMKFYSNNATPTPSQIQGADFNSNSKIDLLDVIGVLRTVVDSQNGKNITFDACN